MANEPFLTPAAASFDAALTQALAAAFPAPKVPDDLRAGVLAAIARERTPDWQRARGELESEYRRSIAALNARYLRRCRDALLAGSSVVLLIGLGVKPLAHALAGVFQAAAPLVAGLLALGLGMAYGAVLIQELFGRRLPRTQQRI